MVLFQVLEAYPTSTVSLNLRPRDWGIFLRIFLKIFIILSINHCPTITASGIFEEAIETLFSKVLNSCY